MIVTEHSPIIVLGNDLCAAIIVTDFLRRGLAVRWFYPPLVPEVLPISSATMIPSLLVPSTDFGPVTPEMQAEVLDLFHTWLLTHTSDTPQRTQFTQIPIRNALPDMPSSIVISGVLDARALEIVLRDVAAIHGVQPEVVSHFELVQNSQRVQGVLVDDQHISSTALIQAEPIRFDPIWHLPGITPLLLADEGVVFPNAQHSALWTWIYSFDGNVYVDGDPSVVFPPFLPQPETGRRLISGLRGWTTAGVALTKLAPNHIRVMIVGGSGLLDAPLIGSRTLALLGITTNTPS